MKNASKLLALLLALVLALGTFAFAAAEGNGVTEYQIYVDMSLNAAIENFTSLTPEGQYAVLTALADDAAKQEELVSQLTEEQQQALSAYAASVQEMSVPVTVVFTDAGPFMPPVKVQSTAQTMRLAAAYSDETTGPVDAEGVITEKTVIANTDGTYTLRLSTYVTGEKVTTTVTKTIPVDMVLVLDQSGSMQFDFEGNEYYWEGWNRVKVPYTSSRQYGMQNAVKGFIDAVAEKYDAEDSDHRMAIVTFSGTASEAVGWTEVNSEGATDLKEAIDGLGQTPTGATRIDYGVEKAETLMDSDSGYSYSGTNTERQKVVIVFTDGVPTSGSSFEDEVATAAIATAKNLKDTGATVYTVGIFNGADPDELYGSADSEEDFETVSDGTVGSWWGYDINSIGELILFLIGDMYAHDIPAGNRFLNYLSSNFDDANEIGLQEEGLAGWKLSKNFDRAQSGYYLTASDSASLDGIFTQISENIQTESTAYELDETTVVKDVIADSFELPDGVDASKINVYCETYPSNFTVTAPAPDGVSVTLSDDRTEISVTGFDYETYWCGEDKVNGVSAPHANGMRLVIEIPIEVKDGFWGGNNVPTNGSDSGVYDESGEIIENFDVPELNVPLNPPELTGIDHNIYLLGTAPEIGDLYNSAVFLTESWQNAYVTVTVGSGELTSVSNTGDTTATITVNVAPVSDGEGAEGDPVTELDPPLTATANVHVYKPVLTFADSEINYASEAASDYYNVTNYQSVEWMHSDTDGDTAADTALMGEAPALTLNYTPAYAWLDASNKVIGTEDVNVTVAARIGNTDVTSHTNFKRNPCTNCNWTQAQANAPAFIVHIENVYGYLTIIKTGMTEGEVAIFSVSGPGYTGLVEVPNGGSNTLKVKVGSYTVTEQDDWTWRYTCTSPRTVNVVGGTDATVVKFENTTNVSQWLDGSDYVTNSFGGTNGIVQSPASGN